MDKQQKSELYRRARIRNCTAYLVDMPDGRVITIPQAAKEIGVHRDTLLRRYWAGDRGERLMRPPAKERRAGKTYKLGLSVKEIDNVRQYATGHGIHAARDKFGIPTGAVKCIVNGEDWRLC
jgi:hypothetical protein